MNRFSVVIPVRNGNNRIEETVVRLRHLLGKMSSGGSGIVIADDCSTDGTWDTVRQLIRHPGPAVQGVRLDRPRGQQSATIAALTCCRGRDVVTMDDDLAHPADAIPALLEAVSLGVDLVYGLPVRQAGTLWRRLASRAHQYHLSLITGAGRTVRATSFRAISCSAVDRVLGGPMPFPYLSAQLLTLRPRLRVAAVETGVWPGGGTSRYTPSSLFKLEFGLLRAYGPWRRRLHRPTTAEIATSWIAEWAG